MNLPDQKQHVLQLQATSEVRLASALEEVPCAEPTRWGVGCGVCPEGSTLRTTPLTETPKRSAEELLHELQAQQYELEMQNEALRQAQYALEESRDRYVDLYDFAPVGYLTLTDKGLINEINLCAAKLLGVERGKLLQRRFARFVTPADSDRWHLHFARTLKQEEKLDCELTLQRSDEIPLHVQVDSQRLIKDGQAPTVRIGLTDITKLKLAEFELLQAQHIAHIGSWYWDIKTDKSQVSEELRRIFRRDVIPPFAEQSGIMYPHKTWERQNVAIKEAIRTGVGYNLGLPALRGDGTPLWINSRCDPVFNDSGKVVGLRGTVRDITESKRLNEMLHEKNVELETARSLADKANLTKSDFLSSMSHELRTPLNAILGFAQIMESGSPPPTPSQKRNLDQILKGGWYLLELINEILDLALIESGKATLSWEAVSLGAVMLECRAMIESQAQDHVIGMKFPRFAPPCFVNADRTRLKQVLINLLSNAIKYNRPGGTVAVECSPSPPNSIRISVRDTGTGMTPEQLAQLFQPFNRLGKEAGTEEGTGIGLVVTKRLVEMMGGTIGMESTVGVGSVFWFELSLATAPLLAVPEAKHAVLVRPQMPDGAPLRTLLYVEDNPANLELIEQLIARRPDLQLLSATDGNLGIEFARTHQPEVILMDINLPGISGIDAMKILRADPKTAHIPIIALSANAVPRDIKKGLEAGFFDYITKPIEVNLFMDTLDAALKSGQTESPLAATNE